MPSDSGTTSSKQHVPPAAGEDVGLHGRPERDDLVGIQFGVRRAAEELADPLADVRESASSRRPARLRRFASAVSSASRRAERHLSSVRSMNGSSSASSSARVKRAAIVDASVRQIDGEFGVSARPTARSWSARPGRAGAAAVRVAAASGSTPSSPAANVHERPVEVVAAEVGVAVGAEHLEDAVADRQDRAIEGAAAEVVDGDGAGFRCVESVGQGRGRRLVDDAEHVQPGDAAGVARRLPLACRRNRPAR